MGHLLKQLTGGDLLPVVLPVLAELTLHSLGLLMLASAELVLAVELLLDGVQLDFSMEQLDEEIELEVSTLGLAVQSVCQPLQWLLVLMFFL